MYSEKNVNHMRKTKTKYELENTAQKKAKGKKRWKRETKREENDF